MPRETPPSIRYVRDYWTPGRTVVELHGAIDIAAALHLTPELDAATDGPNPSVVIDLTPVEFMDCSGLRLLCRARLRVEERDGQLTLVCPQPVIRKMLRITDLSRLFTLSATLDEALGGHASAS
ncbi:STAS domain-containing protein [Streptomyces sp. NPDC051572]|uniref:STAS domain-containing protein n=1 Tax=Streptomyces sp. NPDC051572 TaxID=3155802 RepID=UPI00344F537D